MASQQPTPRSERVFGHVKPPPASLIAKSSKLANVEPDTRASLPDFLSTLVAREDGFEERFPDIFEKRRSKI